jgi:hypothetical protein
VFRSQPGVSSMMVAMLIAGIGLLLAGLLAIGSGIPVKEFSFGNTLILTGTVAACTGMIILGLGMVVRELQNIARRLGPGLAAEARAGTALESGAAGGALDNEAPEDGGLLFGRDQPAAQIAVHADPSVRSPPPWQGETTARDRIRADVPSAAEPGEAGAAAKLRRNLLFSSSRKERERAQTRTTEPSAADSDPAPTVPPPTAESSEGPRATFEGAWPKSERSRATDPPPRRSGRAPPTFAETGAETTGADRRPPTAQNEEHPPVTVLKSGVVDGMAYSLYSDGSIEAQMPEGMMRFASIDELRAHLDQRP